MARLDIERQIKLEPTRMGFATNTINALGYTVSVISKKEIQFTFEKNIIRLFPYSGWFQGKGIKSGRGIQNLLKQI